LFIPTSRGMSKETREPQPSPEERLRRETAERLNAMMARSMRMLDDCAMLAATGKTDAAGAVTAAARLLKSNADVTHALVYAIQGETRRRSIVEHINGGSPGLNPNFSAAPNPNPNKGALKEFLYRFACLTEARKAEEEGRAYIPPPREQDEDDAGDDA
jgi:hypothetical protein